MNEKTLLDLYVALTYVPNGLVGRSLELEFTVGKHSGFVSLGQRRTIRGFGRPWLVGMIGKHTFVWR